MNTETFCLHITVDISFQLYGKDIAYLTHHPEKKGGGPFALIWKIMITRYQSRRNNETASFRNDEVILTGHAHLKGVTIIFGNLHAAGSRNKTKITPEHNVNMEKISVLQLKRNINVTINFR